VDADKKLLKKKSVSASWLIRNDLDLNLGRTQTQRRRPSSPVSAVVFVYPHYSLQRTQSPFSAPFAKNDSYCSLRMEEAYLDRIKRFIFFHGKRHSSEPGAPQVEVLITHLTGMFK